MQDGVLPWQRTSDQKNRFIIPKHEAAIGLWLGARGDASEAAVLLDQGVSNLPALLVIETGSDLGLDAKDELQIRFHEVFSGKQTFRSIPLGQQIHGGRVTRLFPNLNIEDLEPGYYLVTVDIRQNGGSVTAGRVGCDDFYLKKIEESMTYTVLSVRTGMALWAHDLFYGDIMGGVRASLPHVYDPLCKETYREFINLFATNTGKHTEGNEAGDTGLALAAEAFRKSGDLTRCRFTEELLKDSVRRMIDVMQAPNGGVRTMVNELAREGIGKIAPGWHIAGWCVYDTNQIGEWLRAIVYALLYFRQVPEEADFVQFLNRVCRQSANYLVEHSCQDCDGVPHVIRHLHLIEHPFGTMEQKLHYEEGRQCDVYLGRALAGLSYYAYAMQLAGDQVPELWWQVLDNSVEWCRRKIKPNGWFDWQCEDVVEHGVHTFLGNLYLGEGVFGVYLANRLAGRHQQEEAAEEMLQRVYRYVTDDCVIRGIQFKDYFGATELWVAGYTYWLFTEYLAAVGCDESIKRWLDMLHQHLSVARGWRDLLDRPALGHGCNWQELCARPYTPDDYAYRADSNGMLTLAILGYLAIKHMEEIGQPFQLPAVP